ncbi:MAG: hypothetical protein LBF27_25885 [Sphingobacterium sp.]|jgi:hypothetical protein|nr:hypothetical protein [Sphingobacterium sp.]
MATQIVISLTLVVTGVLAAKVWEHYCIVREIKRLELRNKELDKLKMRIDRAIETENAILQMIEDGDPMFMYFHELNEEERLFIQRELERLGLSTGN